jgi:hypothetical protein
MFEDLKRGPKCPMCNKIATEINYINGQLACYHCRRAIRKGKPIMVFKGG